MTVTEAEAAEMKRRHEAHVADLMSKALLLMIYQTESIHGASPEQTAFVSKLSEARDAAQKLAKLYG